MKAYVLGRPENGRASWKLTSLPDPTPDSGEVLVRVRAASLNYRDLMVARGLYGGTPRADLVPLSDGAGEIVALGQRAKRFRVGQRVVGAYYPTWLAGPGPQRASHGQHMKGAGNVDGVLAEYVTFPETGVVPAPSHLSFEAASTLPCAALTAYNALFVAGPRLDPGATVLVLGTGGVSVMAAQFALAAGLRPMATSSSAKKLERFRSLGVTDVVDYRQTPEWQDEVLRLTGGEGADHIVDVGGAGTLPRSFQAVKIGGTISLIGILAGATHIDPLPILFRRIRVQGLSVGPVALLEAMNRSIEATKFEPAIDEVFPFARAPEALVKLEDGAHFGKLVVRID
jgi:NADPH:quinone reductase-like Zn-dependent oxidoreductase